CAASMRQDFPMARRNNGPADPVQRPARPTAQRRDPLLTAQAAYKAGRPFQARTILERELRLNPDNYQARLALGVMYSESEHWKEAAECLRYCLQADGRDLKALTQYGRALQGLHNYAGALRVFEIAYALRPAQLFADAIEQCRHLAAQPQ